jgi:hypothetical protein
MAGKTADPFHPTAGAATTTAAATVSIQTRRKIRLVGTQRSGIKKELTALGRRGGQPRS